MDVKKELEENYEYLHRCPEIGFELDKTINYVMKKLKEIGCTPIKCGKAGIIADIGSKKGKTILLRADMDALPMREESGCEYASNNGNMHACGHDAHTTMLLGAARILKKYEEKLNGRVRLMFQPAEEILEGAKDMITNGVLKNPDVNYGVMMHVMTGIQVKSGTIIVSEPGISAPAADYISITIKGVGGHGAMPYRCVDPLNIAAHILIALNNIKSKELPMEERFVLSVSSISSGNEYNIIPDCVIMKASMRAYSDEVREMVKKRIIELAEGISQAFGGEVKVSFDRGCPTLINDEELSAILLEQLGEILGKDKVVPSGKLSGGGSEDFAYVSHEIPTIMLGLAAGNSQEGYEYNLHHPKMRLDISALENGAKAYAASAIILLDKSEIA